MKLSDTAKKVENSLRSNSPAILTGIGVSGTVTTAFLAAKAGYESFDLIRIEKNRSFATNPSHVLTRKEKVKVVWKRYIPAAISGALTVGCVIGAARVGSKRAAAAYSLLSVSERAFVEYKEKVVEQLGIKKEQVIHDEIAKDRMAKDPVSNVVVLGSGEVLCYEIHTGRYFMCEIVRLKRAENEINSQMIRENEASMNDFYHLVGLPYTSFSSKTGWNSDKMLELRFSTQMSEDMRPCVCFEYNYVIPF